MTFLEKYNTLLKYGFVVLIFKGTEKLVYFNENLKEEDIYFSYLDIKNRKVEKIYIKDLLNDFELKQYTLLNNKIDILSKKSDFPLFNDGIFESVGLGWTGILKGFYNNLNELIVSSGNIKFTLTQFKEKMGGIRLYNKVNYINEDIVDEYDKIATKQISFIRSLLEFESEYVCEICGEGCVRRNINGWYYSVCDNHAKEIEEKGFNNISRGKMLI